MIETDRLIMRRWRDEDRAPYAAMCADPAVMDWLGGTRTRAESEADIDRFDAQLKVLGRGFFALERKADGAFFGIAGLSPVPHPPPVPQGHDLGWRLVRAAWGQGYASEAAYALLRHGFERLKLPEIFAWTATTNLRSQAVMHRLGLTRRPDLDFDHPALALGHPLRAHVVYSAPAPLPQPSRRKIT